MRKPGFGLVTLVVTLIVLLGGAMKALRPLLPRDLPNRMQLESADFLRQATYERVDWRPVSTDVFAEARRLDKPVFILVGTPWSQMGRYADRTIFTDSEVQTFLNRNYICVRIDGCDHPEWLSCFLPLSRSAQSFFPAFQMWMLDSKGRLYDYLSPISVDLFNAQSFLDMLIASRRRLAEMQAPDSTLPPAGAGQDSNVAEMLTGSGMGYPDRATFLTSVRTKLDPQNGGLPDGEYQHLMPLAGISLLRLGDRDLFEKLWFPAMKSGIIDWMDGGFFRSSAKADWTQVQFDKAAIQNGYLMQMCIEAHTITGTEAFDRAAKATFDMLVTLMAPTGHISPCLVGDDGYLFRSRRSSFSVRVLRDLRSNRVLTAEEMDFLRNQMGLRVEVNPQLNVRVPNLKMSSVEATMFEGILAKLKIYRQDVQRVVSGGIYLDVNASVCSHLIQAARHWNDPERLAIATAMFDKLSAFRDGNDVRHSLFTDRNLTASLTDYLYYADAALQDYLATGRSSSLKDGLKVLDRARVRFESDSNGVWYMTHQLDEAAWPENFRTPVIVDDDGESAAAMTIRLLYAYGRLLSGSSDFMPGPNAVSMLQESIEGTTHFAEAASKLGPKAGGYMAAALQVMNDTHVIAVGPNAQEQSNAVARRFPALLVAPAYDIVRPDLQTKKSGLYVIRFGRAEGPFSVQQTIDSVLRGVNSGESN